VPQFRYLNFVISNKKRLLQGMGVWHSERQYRALERGGPQKETEQRSGWGVGSPHPGDHPRVPRDTHDKVLAGVSVGSAATSMPLAGKNQVLSSDVADRGEARLALPTTSAQGKMRISMEGFMFSPYVNHEKYLGGHSTHS
jgi:hypothetical protein